jgi:hypothetical protein
MEINGMQILRPFTPPDSLPEGKRVCDEGAGPARVAVDPATNRTIYLHVESADHPGKPAGRGRCAGGPQREIAPSRGKYNGNGTATSLLLF